MTFLLTTTLVPVKKEKFKIISSDEMKFSFLHGMTKIFSKTPEKKLPDTFLNPLNNLTITTTTVDEEAKDEVDEEDDELKKSKYVSKTQSQQLYQDKKRKIRFLEKDKKKDIIKQDRVMTKELKKDLKLAKGTIDGKQLKHYVL